MTDPTPATMDDAPAYLDSDTASGWAMGYNAAREAFLNLLGLIPGPDEVAVKRQVLALYLSGDGNNLDRQHAYDCLRRALEAVDA